MSVLRLSSFALSIGLALLLALLAGGRASARPGGSAGSHDQLVEVVVTLPQAPLARAVAHDRTLAGAVRRRHAVDVRAPAAVSYLRTLAAAQRTLQARLVDAVPGARIHWRYRVALDGMAVVLPRSELSRLRALRGVTVWPIASYHALGGAAARATADAAVGAAPALIGAAALWGPNQVTAGQGMKIAIIDDGVDQTHPYFSAKGYTYPPGFPKGNTAYTTPKVIVARSFPSPSTSWKYAARPFDPEYSEHATHVAGIAAGDDGTIATDPDGDRVRVSGTAPRAYLGNYKVLTVPTTDYGLDGNAPEIAKAIDQAVADGMNVINLSLGEPAIEPSRDIVVRALDNAAAAGVVPVVAAGNDYDNAGHGSIGSPANAPAAIAVAASSVGAGSPPDEIASFSSAGPTPISLLLKPDVTAPGEDILSSIPHDSWDVWDGTSMATPQVAGAAALLMQRHPTWTVEQIKSALESTGVPVHVPGTHTEVTVSREGGGRIDLVQADAPLVFTDPANLSWGLVGRGFVGTKHLLVSDAGGGVDPWNVSVTVQSAPAGVSISPAAATVTPGTTLGVTVAVSEKAAVGEVDGFVLLSRAGETRRVPLWFHVEVPRLGRDPHRPLTHVGLYRGDTAHHASRVSSYRYPDHGVAPGVPTSLTGPEQVFRFVLKRRVANFGVVVLTHGKDVRVSPRLVQGDDENRLVGYTGIPATLNPYVGLPRPYPVVGAVLPLPGVYDVVFDTPAGGKPGPFLFRFWINDTTPPTVQLLHARVRVGQPIQLAVRDTGSGVDPQSLSAARDGVHVPLSFTHGIVSLGTTTLAPGVHRITLRASDYQEAKNMEDVGPVLPNTRVFHATVTVEP